MSVPAWTEDRLHDLMWKWQGILKISDWKVDLVFKRPWDLDSGSLGFCRTDLNRKTATIEMMTPNDQTQQGEDPEETLVHELLHLHTAGFHHPSVGLLKKARKVAMEQLVDLVSIALVALKRQVPDSEDVTEAEVKETSPSE